MKNTFWTMFFLMITFIGFQCSKWHDHNPVTPPEEEPVPCEPCKVFDLTVRYTLGGNKSFPDVYAFERGGFPDEEIVITSIDTSFTRVLIDYIGEPYGLRIKKGSGAKVVGSSVIKFECGGEE